MHKYGTHTSDIILFLWGGGGDTIRKNVIKGDAIR